MLSDTLQRVTLSAPCCRPYPHMTSFHLSQGNQASADTLSFELDSINVIAIDVQVCTHILCSKEMLQSTRSQTVVWSWARNVRTGAIKASFV